MKNKPKPEYPEFPEEDIGTLSDLMKLQTNNPTSLKEHTRFSICTFEELLKQNISNEQRESILSTIKSLKELIKEPIE